MVVTGEGATKSAEDSSSSSSSSSSTSTITISHEEMESLEMGDDSTVQFDVFMFKFYNIFLSQCSYSCRSDTTHVHGYCKCVREGVIDDFEDVVEPIGCHHEH